MKKRIATIILNRNLPGPTDQLCDHLLEFDGNHTDIFVVEAGSDIENLSKNTTWHANWPEAIESGLRYPRGMNYGLSQLWDEGKFEQYDAFFLLTNDTELNRSESLGPLMSILDENQRVGILSPCSKSWGEKLLLEDGLTKYFWFIHNTAYLLRREFIEDICNVGSPGYLKFLFDGQNFRGYGVESELIAKAYANDWAAAITSEVWAEENQAHLLKHSDKIKTENYRKNIDLYIQEGESWMKNKYGFNSRWQMQQYVKSFYDRFFYYHPEFRDQKV